MEKRRRQAPCPYCPDAAPITTRAFSPFSPPYTFAQVVSGTVAEASRTNKLNASPKMHHNRAHLVSNNRDTVSDNRDNRDNNLNNLARPAPVPAKHSGLAPNFGNGFRPLQNINFLPLTSEDMM